jgi:hypothetical protein
LLKSAIIINTGLNFKLDVGLYRLDQQVACQRYRQNLLTANVKESLVNAWGNFKLAFATPVLQEA